MRKCLAVAFYLVLILSSLAAANQGAYQTAALTDKIRVDGKLNEQNWEKAAAQGGFSFLKTAYRTDKPSADTSFKLLYDQDNIYIGITCQEPLMEKLKAEFSGPSLRPWLDDVVEIFLSPSGTDESYYQFVIGAGGATWQEFYAEGGKIKPVYFAPHYEVACSKGDDSWCVEMRLPMWAFYMTNTSQWNQTWLVNICRDRKPLAEMSTWSPLDNKFHESKSFRSIGGFPMKQESQDIAIGSANAVLGSGLADSVWRGSLSLELSCPAHLPLKGKVELNSAALAKPVYKEINLEGQAHYTLSFPNLEFRRLGRERIDIRLVRDQDLLFSATQEVYLDYTPLRLVFTNPAYAQCYFPGQNCERSAGMVEVNLPDVKQLELQIGEQSWPLAIVDGIASFDLKTSLKPGTHQVSLRAVCNNGKTEQLHSKLRVLQQKGKMLWIEDGRLMVNGKQRFHLDWYGANGGMGKKYLERYPSAKHRAPCNAGGWVHLQSKYLVRGLEQEEGTKDVRPSQQLFDKIKEKIEQNRDNDKFDFYYLNDEPECRAVSPVWLKHQYDYIKELDPTHPVLIISRSPLQYLDCCDVMAPHPYINPRYNEAGKRIYGRPPGDISKMLQSITQAGRPDKVAMLCPSAFASNKRRPIYASFDEVRAMLWSAVAVGCRGFMPYVFREYISDHALAAAYDHSYFSFDLLADWLMQKESLPLQVDNAEIKARLLENDGVLLLILANVSQNRQKVNVSSEALLRQRRMWRFSEAGRQNIRRGKFSLKMAPFQVLLLTSDKLDETLTSLPDTVKEYQRLEKQRQNNGNLLLERYSDIEVNSSTYNLNIKPLTQCSRLINGFTDDIAWIPARDQKPWYELSLTGFKPEFNLVRIHGAGLAGAELELFIDQVWQKAPQEGRKEEKFMLEYRLPEKIKADKLRVDFVVKSRLGYKDIELYEFELLDE